MDLAKFNEKRFGKAMKFAPLYLSLVVGYQYLRSSELRSGQPSVENGQRPDENHVSSTSSSRVRCVQPHFSHFVGSSRLTLMCPHASQYHID